jgi:hypothetical protein
MGLIATMAISGVILAAVVAVGVVFVAGIAVSSPLALTIIAGAGLVGATLPLVHHMIDKTKSVMHMAALEDGGLNATGI